MREAILMSSPEALYKYLTVELALLWRYINTLRATGKHTNGYREL